MPSQQLFFLLFIFFLYSRGGADLAPELGATGSWQEPCYERGLFASYPTAISAVQWDSTLTYPLKNKNCCCCCCSSLSVCVYIFWPLCVYYKCQTVGSLCHNNPAAFWPSLDYFSTIFPSSSSSSYCIGALSRTHTTHCLFQLCIIYRCWPVAAAPVLQPSEQDGHNSQAGRNIGSFLIYFVQQL